MLSVSCTDCVGLFCEMRSAITEAKSILQDAGGRSRARYVPIEDVNEWGQITERWENAHRDWLVAAANLKNHFATHPRHVHTR